VGRLYGSTRGELARGELDRRVTDQEEGWNGLQGEQEGSVGESEGWEESTDGGESFTD